MKRSRTLTRRLALVLLQYTARLLPKGQAEWAQAMRSELHHLDRDYEALVWAVGCLISGIKERVHSMGVGNLRISRWILVPEMALCFVPLTLGWLDVLFGVSGVVRLNVEVIQQYFIGVPGGLAALVVMFSGALFGVLGPLGLLVAFRFIALGRPIRSRLVSRVLILGPILFGVIYIAGNVIMGSGAQTFGGGFLLLFIVLPVVGAAHILYLGPSNPEQKVAA